MREIADVLTTAGGPRTERLAAHRAFLQKRGTIWRDIQEGKFPDTYRSTNNRTFVGAPRKTAIRCDFLLASKIALGAKYPNVLRDREVFPNRSGKKFYCCPKCTSKLHECVSSKVFRYIDNAKWKIEIESDRKAQGDA